MQRYDAVLFDVDGTLIHSRPGIFNCFAYAFRKMGLDPDAIDCSRYLGPPLRWSFAQHFATDARWSRPWSITACITRKLAATSAACSPGCVR